MDEVGKIFGVWNFLGVRQRRGAHVSTPEIGSRGEVFCSGGILGFCAELRRESEWGNFIWGFLRFLIGDPRGYIEEGGMTLCTWRNLGWVVSCEMEWVDLRCSRKGCFPTIQCVRVKVY
jgi:hypothetical protein